MPGTLEQAIETPPKRRKAINPANTSANHTTSKINVEKALKLRLQGLSYADIGKHFNCSKVAVFDRLKRFTSILDDPESIQSFKANHDDLLTSAQCKLLSAALNDDAIKKSSTLQLTTAYSQLFDKQRIINNLSTQNVSIRDISTHLFNQANELEQQIKALSAQDVDMPNNESS